MKLKVFAGLTALIFLAACESSYQATNTGSNRVVVVAPASLETAFAAQYPHATRVVWSHYNPVTVAPLDWELAGFAAMNDGDYVVEFTQDGEYYYTWYHYTGNWVGSAYTLKDMSSTPPAITNTIRNKYPYYLMTSVTKEFKDNAITYEVELKNTTEKLRLLLDENGIILKEKNPSL